MTRGRRIGLIGLAIVLLLPLAVVAMFMLLVDSEVLKARAADAVRRATGRELVIAGPIGLTWSLAPTIALRDVSLSNPPGMSRPAMARLARVEAQMALLPLLSRRVEVRSVTLIEPDILLERNAAGQPNWVFTPPITEPPAVAAPSGAPTPGMQLSVNAVSIRSGRVAWRNPSDTIELLVPELTATAAGPADPVTLAGKLGVNGLDLGLTGITGPLAEFGKAGWPLQVKLAGNGVQGDAQGMLGPEGAIALSASVADLTSLPPLTGRALPPLREVQVSARLTSAGVSDIQGQIGASDLSAWRPGLRLIRSKLTAPAMAQPVTLTAEGMAGDAAVAFTFNAGSLAALLGSEPIPVQVLLLAAGASVGGQGSVADLTGRDLDLTVSARVPDLAALGAVAGVLLPPLRDVAFDAQTAITPDGALALQAMRLVTPVGDVAGDVVLGRLPRPSLRGMLASQHLDLDALMAAPAPTAVPPAPGAPAPEAVAAPPDTRMLSDAPLPFAVLRRADADLRVSVAEAVWRGASYRAVEGRVLLQDAKLRVEPLQAQVPGGTLQALVTADAAAVPAVSVELRAPGLAAKPVLALFGAPDTTTGQLDVDLQLRGAGGSLRAIAASLDGFLGLAMVEGELDNRWLVGLLGEALRNIPVDMGGRSRVRCLALRFDVVDGQAATRAMLLDATRLRLEGEGGVNLANETLDLRLRTLVRLGPTSVAVPVHLAGPWRSLRPRVAADGGALVIGAAPGPDTCAAQLTLARNGRAGPMPTAAAPAAAEAPRSLKPADLLRSLLR